MGEANEAISTATEGTAQVGTAPDISTGTSPDSGNSGILGTGSTIPVQNLGSGPTAEAIESNRTALAPPSIYGDLQVQWPEGIDESLTNDPTLKPYVGQDGVVNINGALKSLAHAQRNIGRDRVMIPHDNTTPEEWTDFHQKVFGYEPDINNYKVDYDVEKGLVTEEFFNDFKSHAHENMYPSGLVEDMLGFLDTKIEASNEVANQSQEENIQAGQDFLKEEWGEGYDKKLTSARMVLQQFGDEDMMDYVNNSYLKDDPMVAIFLSKIGDKMFGEDSFRGEDSVGRMGGFTPAEADQQINSVYGDPKHPFHNRSHPGHKDAQEQMLKLFAAKSGERG